MVCINWDPTDWCWLANRSIDACSIAFDNFVNVLEQLKEGDANNLALAVKMMAYAPKNIKSTVWTQWESMMPLIALFTDYWIVFYIFTRNLAQMEKPSSYLRTLSCTLLSLVHNNEMPSTLSIDLDRIVKENEKDDSAALLKTPLNINSMPIFLTITHSLNGLIKSYFHGEPPNSEYSSLLLLLRMLIYLQFVDCCIIFKTCSITSKKTILTLVMAYLGSLLTLAQNNVL